MIMETMRLAHWEIDNTLVALRWMVSADGAGSRNLKGEDTFTRTTQPGLLLPVVASQAVPAADNEGQVVVTVTAEALIPGGVVPRT
jgi:hypothetical protein